MKGGPTVGKVVGVAKAGAPVAMQSVEKLIRGAAAILRARGVPQSSRRVSSLARLARSFHREGMGWVEALSRAAALSEPSAPLSDHGAKGAHA